MPHHPSTPALTVLLLLCAMCALSAAMRPAQNPTTIGQPHDHAAKQMSICTQMLTAKSANINVIGAGREGTTRVNMQLRQEDLNPSMPVVMPSADQGQMTHEVSFTWPFLKNYAQLCSHVQHINQRTSNRPQLFPKPSVAHMAASALPNVAFDLDDYLKRADAANNIAWAHTAAPTSLILASGHSFGAVADILDVTVTDSVATLALEVVHNPRLIGELQSHARQTLDANAHYHFHTPEGAELSASKLLALLQASGGQLQGITLFMKGKVSIPCQGKGEGDSCTEVVGLLQPRRTPPWPLRGAIGPCETFTCQVDDNGNTDCLPSFKPAGQACQPTNVPADAASSPCGRYTCQPVQGGGVDCLKNITKTAGEVCESRKGVCRPARVCTGEDVTCFKTVAPNGIRCPYTIYDHNPLLFPLAKKDPEAAAAASRYGGGEPYGGWPECYGGCQAGTCALDESHPGCCYLAHDDPHQQEGYHGYGPYETKSESFDRGHEDYKNDDNLICWGN